MEFNEVVRNSDDIKELNENIRKYLEERNLQDTEEGSKHYWALFYAWKDNLRENT